MGQTTDERFMTLALDEAHRCLEWDDVPVGCVIVRAAEVVAAAASRRASTSACAVGSWWRSRPFPAAATGAWRLEGCTLYVTLEPCAMCAGAIVLARVDRVVFGATDPKAGFGGSLGNLLQDERLNHRTEVTDGVLGDECGHLLRSFFRERR